MPHLSTMNTQIAWSWPILALAGNVLAFYLLSRNPDFKKLFSAKEQEWHVNAVWFSAQHLVSFLLICNFLLGPQIRDKCKNSLLLNVFLSYICLAFPAVIGHLAEYPEFHIKVDDVHRHNSRKMNNVFAACLFAVSSWGLSKTYGLSFESGVFSSCLGYAMMVSLAIVDKTGNKRDNAFILGTYVFCFLSILCRKYLEKKEHKDTTRHRNDQSPDDTDTVDQSPFDASHTNDLQAITEPVGTSTLNEPIQISEVTVRICGDGTSEGLMVEDNNSQRGLRQESWDVNENHWEIFPPRLYNDSSSCGDTEDGDTEDGEEEEEEVPYMSEYVGKEGEDIIIKHLETSHCFAESKTVSDECVGKIKVMRLSTSSSHMEKAGCSRFGGYYQKDNVPLLSKSHNIIDGETPVINIVLGHLERSNDVDESAESGSQAYNNDDNLLLLLKSSKEVDNNDDDDEDIDDDQIDDSNSEFSDGEGSDDNDFHGGTGCKLGFGNRQKDPGQDRHCEDPANMRLRERACGTVGNENGQDGILSVPVPSQLQNKTRNLVTISSRSSRKVIFTNLDTLRIMGAYQLNNIWIWEGQQIDGLSFRNLRTLKLVHCHGFSKLLSFYVLEFLHNLEDLSIYDYVNKDWNSFECGLPELEEPYRGDGLEASTQLHLLNEKSIQELRKLTMDCHNIMMTYSPHFCLKKHQILKLFGDVSNTFLSLNIQKMYVLEPLPLDYGSIEEILPLEGVSSEETQYSREMQIKTITSIGLSQLNTFGLRKHEILKLFGDATNTFPSLYIQKMYALEPLALDYGMIEGILPRERVSSEETQYSKEMQIKTITSIGLSQINTVEIVGDKLSGDEISDEITLSKLKTLELNHLSQLESFCSQNHMFNFPSLGKEYMQQCLKLKIPFKQPLNTPKLQTWSEDGHWEIDINSTVSNLCVYKLYCELQHFNLLEYPTWRSYTLFCNLSTLTLPNCEWLSEALPLNDLRFFIKLKEQKKKSLVAIFDLKGATDEERDNVLTIKLSTVTLTSMPNINHIWNKDRHEISHFHDLSTLTLADLPQPQPLSHGKLFYQPEHLHLPVYPELNQIWHSQLLNGSFRNLCSLTVSVSHCFLKMLPLKELNCLVNLELLKVKSCNSREVVCDHHNATDEERVNILTMKLRTLTSTPSVKHAWSNDSHIILDFPELTRLKLADVPKPEPLSVEKVVPHLVRLEVDKEARMTCLGQVQPDHFNKVRHLTLTLFNEASTRLAVVQCPSLLNIKISGIPSNLLRTLNMKRCEQFLFLSGTSAAKRLGHLETLELRECNMLKEIVDDEETDAETTDNISFSKLENLKLVNLSCFERLCSRNCDLNIPSLKNIVKQQCPNVLKMLSKQAPNKSKLQCVKNSKYWYATSFWEDDHNSIVQKWYRNKIASQWRDNAVSHMNKQLIPEINRKHQVEGDLPTELSLNIRKKWDNFDSGVGPSCSEEVKANEVVQSTQDCQTESMARHSGGLEAKEVHQEQKMPHISPINRRECVKGRAEEIVKKDLTVSPLEIIKQMPKSELVLRHQRHTLEESNASKQQLLARNSRLSPFSGSPQDSYQSFSSLAEASGRPLTSDAAITSLSCDLLSRLHLLLSSEAMAYLQDGFCRYPWTLSLLESWSDKPWNWYYFVIFARVLSILQTTTVSNLSEALCSELSSSLSILEIVGFDASWIAAVQTLIHNCQVNLYNLHETKKLRATKDAMMDRSP